MPYRMNIQEVVQETYSDLDKGLSEQEAAARLRDQGKNELLKKKKETVFQMFLEQFQDPMVIILIIGAIVSVFLKEYKLIPRSWSLAIWWSWKWEDTYRPICVWCHPLI